MSEMKILNIVPRCPGCKNHSEYMLINKNTGETKYFCSVCGTIHLYNLKDNGWDVIHIG